MQLFGGSYRCGLYSYLSRMDGGIREAGGRVLRARAGVQALRTQLSTPARHVGGIGFRLNLRPLQQ